MTFDELYAEALRLTAVDLSQAGKVAKQAERLARKANDPRALGLAERALGHVAVLRSRYRDAVAHYEASVARLDEAGLAFEAAVTRSGGVGALIFLADHGRVEEWAREARREFEARNDRVRLARLDGNLAFALFRQDRFEEAYRIYERLHREFLETGRSVDIANVLWNKATCLISLGDYVAAGRAHREAREFAERHGMAVHVAAVDYNVAYLHYLCGDYTDAMRLFDVARKTGAPYRRALCDLDEAEMYLELNLHREASQLAQRAIRQFQRLGMPYEKGKATVFRALAEGQQGRAPLAIRLIASARRTFQRERNLVWLALLDLYGAILYDRLGRLDKASAAAHRAREFFDGSAFPAKAVTAELLVARIDARLGRWPQAYERCLRARRTLEAAGSPSLEYQAAQLEAELLESMGRHGEARMAYETALDRLEHLRFRLRGDEIKIAFLKDKLSVYDSLFWLTLTDPGVPDRVRSAFQLAEMAKSRSLAEQVQSSPAGSGDSAELRFLRRDLDSLYQQIHRAETGQAQPLEPEHLARLRASVVRQEAHLAGRLAARKALDSNDAKPAGPFDPGALGSWLPPETQIVEYFVSRETVFAFLLDRRQLRVWPLAPLSRVQRTASFLRLQLQRRSDGDEAARRHLRQLYVDLVEPLAPLLDGDHLAIVPHGVLHGIPFAALYDGERHLIDRYAVSQAPSCELLRFAAERPAGRGHGSLIAGVPDEDAPRIEDEAKALASLLPDAKLLLGPEASVTRLREEAKTARLLHLAAHGYFHRQNPLFSSIRMAGSWLTVFDLHRFELVADLVTLSGCSTGRGEVVGADEVVGLVRGLLQAGARAALVSLWDVDDESTLRFMEIFYGHLATGGLPAADALRRTCLELRGSYSGVYRWAPFCLIGLGREPDKKKSASPISNA